MKRLFEIDPDLIEKAKAVAACATDQEAIEAALYFYLENKKPAEPPKPVWRGFRSK